MLILGEFEKTVSGFGTKARAFVRKQDGTKIGHIVETSISGFFVPVLHKDLRRILPPVQTTGEALQILEEVSR